jgi:hypothetical protein
MNAAIFWDIAQCNPYVNRLFGGTYHLHIQGRKSAEQETRAQQVVRLIPSSETSIHIRTTQRYIPEDGNIHLFMYMGYTDNGVSIRRL